MKKNLFILVLLMLFCLAGCKGKEDKTLVESKDEPTQTEEPTPEATTTPDSTQSQCAFKFEKDEYDVKIGDTIYLSHSHGGYLSIKSHVDDSSIISFSSFHVTGLKEGSTNLTIECQHGNKFEVRVNVYDGNKLEEPNVSINNEVFNNLTEKKELFYSNLDKNYLSLDMNLYYKEFHRNIKYKSTISPYYLEKTTNNGTNYFVCENDKIFEYTRIKNETYDFDRNFVCKKDVYIGDEFFYLYDSFLNVSFNLDSCNAYNEGNKLIFKTHYKDISELDLPLIKFFNQNYGIYKEPSSENVYTFSFDITNDYANITLVYYNYTTDKWGDKIAYEYNIDFMYSFATFEPIDFHSGEYKIVPGDSPEEIDETTNVGTKIDLLGTAITKKSTLVKVYFPKGQYYIKFYTEVNPVDIRLVFYNLDETIYYPQKVNNYHENLELHHIYTLEEGMYYLEFRNPATYNVSISIEQMEYEIDNSEVLELIDGGNYSGSIQGINDLESYVFHNEEEKNYVVKIINNSKNNIIINSTDLHTNNFYFIVGANDNILFTCKDKETYISLCSSYYENPTRVGYDYNISVEIFETIFDLPMDYYTIGNLISLSRDNVCLIAHLEPGNYLFKDITTFTKFKLKIYDSLGNEVKKGFGLPSVHVYELREQFFIEEAGTYYLHFFKNSTIDTIYIHSYVFDFETTIDLDNPKPLENINEGRIEGYGDYDYYFYNNESPEDTTITFKNNLDTPLYIIFKDTSETYFMILVEDEFETILFSGMNYFLIFQVEEAKNNGYDYSFTIK